jgi:Transglutaminase-like superfamily
VSGPVREPRAPSLVRCVALLALVDASLRLFGMRRTLRWVRGGQQSSAEAAVSQQAIARAVRVVATAAAFYPRRALCLEQSLVLYRMLRRQGAAVRLRVGVQPFPFTAHAWVEHDGRPINEHEDFVMQLSPFPSLGA